MRKTEKLQGKIAFGLATVVMIFAVWFLTQHAMLVVHAQSNGKVTATSANIRKEANPGSTTVGSATKDAVVTINNQVTGTDGAVWYQVYVDANTTGYIRSDLVTITDGTTPPSQTTEASLSATTTTPTTSVSDVAVTVMNPVSGKVKGSDSVRVRSDASTSGNNIVTTATKGTELTVDATTTASDGKVWYRVQFLNNGTQVNGFIRSDYVDLSGELVPVTQDEPKEQPTEELPEEEPVETKKDFETAYVNDTWYLYDYEQGMQYNIQDFISANKQYADLYTDAQKKVKTEKTIIILLVLAMLLMALAIIYLIYKIRDMKDSEYFHQVEQETIKRRTAERPQNRPAQKVMHTVGGQPKKHPVDEAGERGQRPSQQNVQRTVRPLEQPKRPTAQAQPQRRPSEQSKRPMAGENLQRRPLEQSKRPVTEAQPQRPSSEQPRRPMPNAQGQRPVQRNGNSAKPVRPVQNKVKSNSQENGWKSKNFMDEDDEFEFDFLNNWDNEE